MHSQECWKFVFLCCHIYMYMYSTYVYGVSCAPALSLSCLHTCTVFVCALDYNSVSGMHHSQSLHEMSHSISGYGWIYKIAQCEDVANFWGRLYFDILQVLANECLKVSERKHYVKQFCKNGLFYSEWNDVDALLLTDCAHSEVPQFCISLTVHCKTRMAGA